HFTHIKCAHHAHNNTHCTERHPRTLHITKPKHSTYNTLHTYQHGLIAHITLCTAQNDTHNAHIRTRTHCLLNDTHAHYPLHTHCAHNDTQTRYT
ncbi:predicted protein, partial [Nematostella vectensis]